MIGKMETKANSMRMDRLMVESDAVGSVIRRSGDTCSMDEEEWTE